MPERQKADFVARRGPETLRLRGISPSFTVNDLAVSVAWYRDILGFIVVDEYHDEASGARGAMLRAGATDFILAQDDFGKGKNRVKGVGFRLHCRTAQDVDALAESVKTRGGTLTQEPTTQTWGVRDFVVVDPDGFRLSIAHSDV